MRFTLAADRTFGLKNLMVTFLTLIAKCIGNPWAPSVCVSQQAVSAAFGSLLDPVVAFSDWQFSRSRELDDQLAFSDPLLATSAPIGETSRESHQGACL